MKSFQGNIQFYLKESTFPPPLTPYNVGIHVEYLTKWWSFAIFRFDDSSHQNIDEQKTSMIRFFFSPTLYGGKGKQKLLILPQGMRKRRVNALIRSVTMKAWHLYLIHRRWTYNKKQQNFILYKNSPSAFRIFDFFIFYFFEFQKIHEISWIFINCHERYPAQKMYALILFDGDVFLSNPRTPVRGFARRSGDSSKHSKCQNLKILKTSKEVFKLWKKTFKLAFF